MSWCVCPAVRSVPEQVQQPGRRQQQTGPGAKQCPVVFECVVLLPSVFPKFPPAHAAGGFNSNRDRFLGAGPSHDRNESLPHSAGPGIGLCPLSGHIPLKALLHAGTGYDWKHSGQTYAHRYSRGPRHADRSVTEPVRRSWNVNRHVWTAHHSTVRRLG
jgi:hypothetical protein